MTYGLRYFIAFITITLIQPSYGSNDNNALYEDFDILPPTVGPILGKPKDDTIRIWLRGPVLNEISTDTKYYGALNIKNAEQKEWPLPQEFPLQVYFDVDRFKEKKDYSGFLDIPLKPGTYNYRCGYFGCSVDSNIPRNYKWHDESYTFTIRDPALNYAALAFGSCRYFAKLWCWYPWLNKSDRIFKSIVDANHATDAFAVIGDYIYGDFFNIFGQSRTYAQYMDLYEKAMNTEHFKQLIATVPCFNVLDDHEVSNNFGAEYEQTHPYIFRAGMAAYMNYQFMVTPGYKNDLQLKHLGYPMKIGDVPAFMMNARSNRTMNPPRLIAEEEMLMVKNWLNEHKNSPFKVLFSSVPMFPIYANNPGQDDDKWFGFKDQMMELLNYIDENKISGVVICAGDIHKSLYSQIKTPGGIEITSVIASPFFSPWGHDECASSALQTERGINEFISGYPFVMSSQVYHVDAYARLNFLNFSTLRIQLFNANGEWINENDPAGYDFNLNAKPQSVIFQDNSLPNAPYYYRYD